MASPQVQTWTVYRGEDASIVLTGEDNTDPSAYALAFTLSAYAGQSPVTLTVTGPTVSGSGPYVITVPLTRAQTSALTLAEYAADLWRTDTGSNVRLAGGKLVVLTPVRLPA